MSEFGNKLNNYVIFFVLGDRCRIPQQSCYATACNHSGLLNSSASHAPYSYCSSLEVRKEITLK